MPPTQPLPGKGCYYTPVLSVVSRSAVFEHHTHGGVPVVSTTGGRLLFSVHDVFTIEQLIKTPGVTLEMASAAARQRFMGFKRAMMRESEPLSVHKLANYWIVPRAAKTTPFLSVHWLQRVLHFTYAACPSMELVGVAMLGFLKDSAVARDAASKKPGVAQQLVRVVEPVLDSMLAAGQQIVRGVAADDIDGLILAAYKKVVADILEAKPRLASYQITLTGAARDKWVSMATQSSVVLNATFNPVGFGADVGEDGSIRIRTKDDRHPST
jgi:hypothetical protein